MSVYTHLELNNDITAPAGYYTPVKEARIQVGGREVLYVVSQTVVDSSCCGVTDFAAVMVPGYFITWRERTDDRGLPLSEVEPIRDSSIREQVRKIILEKENVNRIEFW